MMNYSSVACSDIIHFAAICLRNNCTYSLFGSPQTQLLLKDASLPEDIHTCLFGQLVAAHGGGQWSRDE